MCSPKFSERRHFIILEIVKIKRFHFEGLINGELGNCKLKNIISNTMYKYMNNFHWKVNIYKISMYKNISMKNVRNSKISI